MDIVTLQAARALAKKDGNVAYGRADDTGYDLVLLLGQSNMSGRGTAYDQRLDPADSRVWQYGSSGVASPYAGQISQAVEPLLMHDTPSGIGPGLVFARWYAASVPFSRRVLLVPTAHGGTQLSVNTSPLGWRRGVAGNLYAQAVAQAQNALAAAGANSKIVAALWVQGESDGDNGVTAIQYQTDLDALITGLRADLGVPGLPFVIGQMVPEYLNINNRLAINTVQAATPARLTKVAFAPGPLGGTNADGNHYNAASQRSAGRRLFDAYRRIVNATPDPAIPSPPGTVTSLAAGATTNTSATISWTAPAGAGSYLITLQPSGGAINEVGAITGTSITITGLTKATAYTVRVSAVNNGGVSAAASISATTTSVTSTLVADTFSRPDSTTGLGTPETGTSWLAAAGTFGIASGRAYVVAGASFAVIDSTAANATVQTTFTGLDAANTSNHSRLVFRYTDVNNFWMVQRRTATNTYQLYKNVAGTFTQVGSDAGVTPAAGDVLTAVVNGSSITVKVNGTTAFTATDGFNSTATKHGLGGTGPSTVTTYDNFSVTDATA